MAHRSSACRPRGPCSLLRAVRRARRRTAAHRSLGHHPRQQVVKLFATAAAAAAALLFGGRATGLQRPAAPESPAHRPRQAECAHTAVPHQPAPACVEAAAQQAAAPAPAPAPQAAAPAGPRCGCRPSCPSRRARAASAACASCAPASGRPLARLPGGLHCADWQGKASFWCALATHGRLLGMLAQGTAI